MAYQVRAHFEWNDYHKDLVQDRNENKHFSIAKRMIERGGRRDIFLGSRECHGYVEACKFGDGSGYYDQYGELKFGMMVHGFDYPEHTGKKELAVRLWEPVMKNGVVHFLRPDQCTVRRFLRKMEPESFRTGYNFSGLSEVDLAETNEGEIDTI